MPICESAGSCKDLPTKPALVATRKVSTCNQCASVQFLHRQKYALNDDDVQTGETFHNEK